MTPGSPGETLLASATLLANALRPVEDATAAFAAALGDEQRALEQNDSDALTEIAARKQQCADRLADARQGLFAAAWRAGCDGDASGVRAWVDRLSPAQPSIAARYEALGAQLAACERDNQIHGRLLAGRIRATETGLDILLGRPERAAPPLYDADGRPQRSGGHGRRLETA
jgi:flagellar biosynthesis/type III secretory pathway chaperone